MLTLMKERLERLIAALEQAEKGEVTMSAFDNSEYETARQQYEDEVKQRWGGTDAYKESQAKTADYSKDKCGMNGVFAEFAECKKCGESADSDAAQQLVKKLQDYITANFYHCTADILAGLGQMYVCDERMDIPEHLQTRGSDASRVSLQPYENLAQASGTAIDTLPRSSSHLRHPRADGRRGWQNAVANTRAYQCQLYARHLYPRDHRYAKACVGHRRRIHGRLDHKGVR